MALIDFDKIKDILGLSKPLTKLIEVIAQGTGAITQPYLIKKNAEAKAYEINVVSKAIAQNQSSLQKIEYKESKLSLNSLDKSTIEEITSLPERAENRIEYQEQKRQQNIERVTQIAAEQLESVKEVSDEKVDEDWTTHFFNYAQDVSNEEMQNLWGRILAGEVESPKSYSLRALELIRNLSKSEAEIFSKVAKYAVKSSNDYFLFKGKKDLLNQKFGITFNDLALLKELGLLHTSEFTSYEYAKSDKPSNPHLVFGNDIVFMEIKENTPKFTINIYLFTTIGKELLKLVDIESDFNYIMEFAKEVQTENTIVKYGQILEVLPDGLRHSVPLKNVI
ncbi:DUF2806 domain-containing protein [Galbibacter sp. EGI 63066]|uniref:DUF2806 domain-containing protein n=1 Tax=Galbibacter sp. EGI 63066 TaxID=2993559 RepID=UPI00224943A7|nr:DUF2806 domain-containing protein [Galbibacter sp. EGI 63066]MCX2681665.1 DUF2806 domain-containing protein [Galbibacter sp. EGI 63066]